MMLDSKDANIEVMRCEIQSHQSLMDNSSLYSGDADFDNNVPGKLTMTVR